jgi:hypothetical protein
MLTVDAPVKLVVLPDELSESAVARVKDTFMFPVVIVRAELMLSWAAATVAILLSAVAILFSFYFNSINILK